MQNAPPTSKLMYCSDQVDDEVMNHLSLHAYGVLYVLRSGFMEHGVRLSVCFFLASLFMRGAAGLTG